MLARENPYYICTTNVTGTANILEAARVLGIKRVVYCSSCTTYGNTPPAPVGEDAPQRPTSVYAASKAAGEQLVMAYSNEHGLDGVSLRLSWVYGPRRWTDCLIRTMISDALDGKPTRLGWGGDFYRQYVYLDDVVAALLLALQADGFAQPVYNITGGSYLTIEQIAASVREVIPDADIHIGPGPDPVDSIQERIDISAAQRDLGYEPQISMRRGIELYRHWLLEQRRS
jgi:nucleoside-diphosphate-sugar epimerase